MPDAILPLKRYFDFFGRSRRREFWLWVLLCAVVSLVLPAVDLMAGLGGSVDTQVAANSASFTLKGGLLSNIWFFGTLLPSFMVTARRLHDSERTSWWIALPALPMLVLISPLPFYLFGFETPYTDDEFRKLIIYFGGLALFGLVTSITLLVFLCLEGTPGTNRYGSDPKGRREPVAPVVGAKTI